MTLHWNWGTKVALVYGLFATGTLAMVAIAVSHRVDLVSPDYYAQALATDSRMAARENARHLTGFSISEDADGLVITWPHTPDGGGTVTLYRASDAAADRVTPVAPARDGRQVVGLSGLPSGAWRLQVSWQYGGSPYYIERVLTLNETGTR